MKSRGLQGIGPYERDLNILTDQIRHMDGRAQTAELAPAPAPAPAPLSREVHKHINNLELLLVKALELMEDSDVPYSIPLIKEIKAYLGIKP
jgi:hypothetical protein